MYHATAERPSERRTAPLKLQFSLGSNPRWTVVKGRFTQEWLAVSPYGAFRDREEFFLTFPEAFAHADRMARG